MADGITDDELDRRLRAADLLSTCLPPSQDETEATLQRLLARGPASPEVHPGRRARLTRPRLVAGAAASAGAVAVALALMFGAVASSPAFAVTRHHDGTITVRIINLSGITGANHALAQMGVRAKIVRALDTARLVAVARPCQGVRSGTVRAFTFYPSRIPRQHVLVLSADRVGHFALGVRLSARARSLARRAKEAPKLIRSARVIAFAVPARVDVGKPGADFPVTVYCGGESFSRR